MKLIKLYRWFQPNEIENRVKLCHRVVVISLGSCKSESKIDFHTKSFVSEVLNTLYSRDHQNIDEP